MQPSPDVESASAGTDNNADSRASFLDEEEEEEDGIVLDPKDPDRYTWRDARTNIEREIWKPGDGDGDRSTDYFEKVNPPANIKDRWKLYQLTLGPIKHDHNEPPKYVFLDDRACYELLQSNVPRAALGKFWPHDFGIAGKMRDRRPHRGRGSVGDPDAEGNDKYHFTQIGQKGMKYYFTGEKDFTPIIYRSEELSAEIAKKLEKKRKGWSIRNKTGDRDPTKRGHNQFTPKDKLVKYGAPSTAKKKKKKKRGLADHQVPDWLLDKPLQVEGSPGGALSETGQGGPGLQQWEGDDLRTGSASPQSKRRKIESNARADAEALSSSPNKMFPFHQQTVGHQAVPAGLQNPLAPIGNGYHQEATCPYTQSRTYALQLERDLHAARDTIKEQKDKIAKLEAAVVGKEMAIEELQREVQDLRWSMGK